jgi:hypothetical protein
MKHLLVYVWKHKLYLPETLMTTEGLSLSVIEGGTYNTDSGPDFLNAKIKTGDTVCTGHIKIHNKASDRHHNNHNNHKDKAHDRVIPHPAATCDTPVCRSDGSAIPQAVFLMPETIKYNIERICTWIIRRPAFPA